MIGSNSSPIRWGRKWAKVPWSSLQAKTIHVTGNQHQKMADCQGNNTEVPESHGSPDTSSNCKSTVPYIYPRHHKAHSSPSPNKKKKTVIRKASDLSYQSKKKNRKRRKSQSLKGKRSKEQSWPRTHLCCLVQL